MPKRHKKSQCQMKLLFRSGIMACAAGATAWAQSSERFQAPYRLKAGGEYIDVDVGHAAPFVDDFDGDGKHDLLVGQFGDGKLRIYLNTGTNENPKYDTAQWFKAEHEFGTVPSG